MSRQAVIAARNAQQRPDTAEIDALARAAGYEVLEVLTQRRAEDAGYELGRGKAETAAAVTSDRDADALIVDGELSPSQAYNLRTLVPEAVDILDRQRLVLDIFAEQATTRTAKLQVELAEMTYTLPRVRAELKTGHGDEASRPEGLDMVDGEHRRIRSIKGRMDRIEAELEERTATAAERRARRREEGFDLLAIVGYTNAGKSTLLHRLADELSVDTSEPAHRDLDSVAAIENRLFKTLETTTRRVTVGGRPVLATDTVGFVDELPHDVVEAFGTTLGAARDADVVLLVVDVAQEPEEIARAVRVSLDAIGDPDGAIVPVANKIDLVDGAETGLDAIRSIRDELVAENHPAADALAEPVRCSALEGTGEQELRGRITELLPGRTTTITVPNCGRAQSLLSWAHEHGAVSDLEYEGDTVSFDFAGRPDVVETALRKASNIESAGAPAD